MNQGTWLKNNKCLKICLTNQIKQYKAYSIEYNPLWTCLISLNKGCQIFSVSHRMHRTYSINPNKQQTIFLVSLRKKRKKLKVKFHKLSETYLIKLKIPTYWTSQTIWNRQTLVTIVYSWEKLTSSKRNSPIKLNPLPSRLPHPLSRLSSIKIYSKAPSPQVSSIHLNNVLTYSLNPKPLPQYSHQHLIHLPTCLLTSLVIWIIWIICLLTTTIKMRIREKVMTSSCKRNRKWPLTLNFPMAIFSMNRLMYSLRRMPTSLRWLMLMFL